MSLYYGSTGIETVKYGSTNIEKVIYGSTTVWENAVNATIYGGRYEPMIITSSDGRTYSVTTNANGVATLKLKKGTYSCKGTISNETFSSNLTKESPYVYGRPTNILYWYGVNNGLQDCTGANGWAYADIFVNSEWNTNNIHLTSRQNNYINAVGAPNPLNATVHVKTGDCSEYMYYYILNEKGVRDDKRYTYGITPSNGTFSVTVPNKYFSLYAVNGNYGTFYGVWM